MMGALARNASTPDGANALSNALDRDHAGRERQDTESILEEGARGARHQLNELIKDATLMWEAIHEPDTRNRANRQIAVADTCASFRNRFRTAIDQCLDDFEGRLKPELKSLLALNFQFFPNHKS